MISAPKLAFENQGNSENGRAITKYVFQVPFEGPKKIKFCLLRVFCLKFEEISN
jgi:hypothetical protein